MLFIVCGDYWRHVLGKNPQYTLEDIRQAYVLDMPIKCNPNELQDHIEELFPTKPLSFSLMHKTRTRDLCWREFAISQIAKLIRNNHSSEFENCTMKRAYCATYDALNDYQWIVIETRKHNDAQYHYFKLKGQHLTSITSIDPLEKLSLYKAIEFNAEILRNRRFEDEFIVLDAE